MMNLIDILTTKIGQKLYSPLFGEVTLYGICPSDYPILVKSKDNSIWAFTADGRYHLEGEVLLFPSKENRDWTTLYHRNKPAINALLDLVDANKLISFLKKNLKVGDKVKTYDSLVKKSVYGIMRFSGAYVEGQLIEVSTIFPTEPLYKIENVEHLYSTEMLDLSYILHNNPRLVYLVEQNLDSLKRKSKFDPRTLKSFDKVLVRDDDYSSWNIDIFQDFAGLSTCLTACWEQCIPYNAETQHLVNTKNKPPKKYTYWR